MTTSTPEQNRPALDAASWRELLRRSFDQSVRIVAAVTPDQLDRPTPCPAFDVRALLGHMVFAAARIGQAGRREAFAEDGAAVTGVADDGWHAALADAAQQATTAWADDSAFDGPVTLPFGTFPAPVVVGMYALEQVTHAWDLARAIGAGELLDDGLAADVLPVARDIIPPEYRGDEPMPFGAEVAVPESARTSDRLAGFMGRDPAAA